MKINQLPDKRNATEEQPKELNRIQLTEIWITQSTDYFITDYANQQYWTYNDKVIFHEAP